MNVEQNTTRLKSFNFGGKEQAVSYVETMRVADGVDCEVYTFDGDLSKDLGIIKINPGCKTPLQKVLKGNRTTEGYVSGKGKLYITKLDGIVTAKQERIFQLILSLGKVQVHMTPEYYTEKLTKFVLRGL